MSGRGKPRYLDLSLYPKHLSLLNIFLQVIYNIGTRFSYKTKTLTSSNWFSRHGDHAKPTQVWRVWGRGMTRHGDHARPAAFSLLHLSVPFGILLWLQQASNSRIPRTFRMKPDRHIWIRFSIVWSWDWVWRFGQRGQGWPKLLLNNWFSTMRGSLLCIEIDPLCLCSKQNFSYSPVLSSDMSCGWLVISGTPEKYRYVGCVKYSRELTFVQFYLLIFYKFILFSSHNFIKILLVYLMSSAQLGTEFRASGWSTSLEQSSSYSRELRWKNYDLLVQNKGSFVCSQLSVNYKIWKDYSLWDWFGLIHQLRTQNSVTDFSWPHEYQVHKTVTVWGPFQALTSPSSHDAFV